MGKRSFNTLAMLMIMILIITMMPLAAFADNGRTEDDGSAVSVPAEPENGIPLIVINVDECELYTDEKGDTYGSIQDMNESEDHSVRCTGSIDILMPEGYSYGYGDSVLSPDAETGKLMLSYIRGRGNATWTDDKKPYKIKFKSGQDLFGMGSSKEWALLANAEDETLMKNRIVSWLGEQMGLQFTPEMVPVDVVMKGSYGSESYLGSYCLSELVSVEENRVNIKELKKSNAEEEGEFNISGGYLISFYNETQDSDEPRNAVFRTENGLEYYIRTPEYEGDDSSELKEGQNRQREYISRYIQDVENLIMTPGSIDEETHNEIAGLMDLVSLADYWLIQEFTRNGDAFMTGSTYLYKDRDSKLCWGPLWDFDASLGDQNDDTDTIDDYEEDVSGFNNSWFTWTAALREKDPLFTELLKERWKLMDGKLELLTKDNGVIDQFKAETAASQIKNSLLWPDLPGSAAAEQYDLVIEKQKKWIDQRRVWLNDNLDIIQKATVTITYAADGTTIKTENVRENANPDEFNPPEAPVKDGKSFVGWYCEEEQQFLGDYSVMQDTVFNARYISNEDEINPAAMYLPRREDWADLQYGKYELITEASFIPENVTFKDVSWSSSKEDIATVSEAGAVTLRGTGDVVVTATHKSGMSASYVLHVYDSKETEAQKITGVRCDTPKISLKTGEAAQIRWTLEPEGQVLENTIIMYESGNESVASVDMSGVVRAQAPGTAVITVNIMPLNADSEGNYKTHTATCEVTVKDAADVIPNKQIPDKQEGATVKLKGTKIKKLRRSSKAITVRWKKQTAKVVSSHISGYQIQLATNRKFTKNKRTVSVKGYKKTSKKIKKLKRGRKYYVRIRTYKVLKGKKYYSSWSKIRSIKTKK